MRSITLFLCFSAAWAEQTEFEKNVAVLRDNLGQTVFNGKHRGGGAAAGAKSMIDRMLASLGNTWSPAETSQLNQIRDALIEIIEHLRSDKVADDASLAAAFAVFATCQNTTKIDNENAMANTIALDRADHRSCRETERDDRVEREIKCRDFEIWMADRSTDCSFFDDYSVATRSDMKEVHDRIKQKYTIFESTNTSFGGYKQACSDATEALATQETNCKVKFQTLNTRSCDLANAKNTRCSDEGTCYANAESHYNSVSETTNSLGEQRKKDAEMIYYLDCLIGSLVADNSLADAETTCQATRVAAVNNGDYNEFKAVVAAVPDPDVCVVPPSDAVPGTLEYYTEEFSDWSTGSLPHDWTSTNVYIHHPHDDATCILA